MKRGRPLSQARPAGPEGGGPLGLPLGMGGPFFTGGGVGVGVGVEAETVSGAAPMR